MSHRKEDLSHSEEDKKHNDCFEYLLAMLAGLFAADFFEGHCDEQIEEELWDILDL